MFYFCQCTEVSQTQSKTIYTKDYIPSTLVAPPTHPYLHEVCVALRGHVLEHVPLVQHQTVQRELPKELPVLCLSYTHIVPAQTDRVKVNTWPVRVLSTVWR